MKRFMSWDGGTFIPENAEDVAALELIRLSECVIFYEYDYCEWIEATEYDAHRNAKTPQPRHPCPMGKYLELSR